MDDETSKLHAEIAALHERLTALEKKVSQLLGHKDTATSDEEAGTGPFPVGGTGP